MYSLTESLADNEPLFSKAFEYTEVHITSRSLVEKLMPRLGIALRIATRDCIVLLYTTGLYCLKSSGVKPLSWIILKAESDSR